MRGFIDSTAPGGSQRYFRPACPPGEQAIAEFLYSVTVFRCPIGVLSAYRSRGQADIRPNVRREPRQGRASFESDAYQRVCERTLGAHQAHSGCTMGAQLTNRSSTPATTQDPDDPRAHEGLQGEVRGYRESTPIHPRARGGVRPRSSLERRPCRRMIPARAGAGAHRQVRAVQTRVDRYLDRGRTPAHAGGHHSRRSSDRRLSPLSGRVSAFRCRTTWPGRHRALPACAAPPRR